MLNANLLNEKKIENKYPQQMHIKAQRIVK